MVIKYGAARARQVIKRGLLTAPALLAIVALVPGAKLILRDPAQSSNGVPSCGGRLVVTSALRRLDDVNRSPAGFTASLLSARRR